LFFTSSEFSDRKKFRNEIKTWFFSFNLILGLKFAQLFLHRKCWTVVEEVGEVTLLTLWLSFMASGGEGRNVDVFKCSPSKMEKPRLCAQGACGWGHQGACHLHSSSGCGHGQLSEFVCLLVLQQVCMVMTEEEIERKLQSEKSEANDRKRKRAI